MGEKRVRVEGGGGLEVAFEEAGADERAFVLVHGFTGDRSDWDEVRGPLTERIRVVTPDLRGHGGTRGASFGEGYTLEGLAADLAGFLDAIGIARCDLLGHSMGGMVALRLALSEPARVASLILMDTSPEPVPVLPRALLDAACRTAREQGMEAIYRVLHAGRNAEHRAPASRAAEARMGEEAYWARIRRKVLAMDPEGFARLYPLLMADQVAVTERLGGIGCPTTVIVGAEDAPFLGPSEILATRVPGARKVVIPDAAHSPQLENTAAWLEAVHDHLDRAQPAAGAR